MLAIYGENEEMALGASQAMQALGLKSWDGQSGIITIGADGLKSGYEFIEPGPLTATVNVGPVDQGRQSVETIFWNVVFGQVPPKIFNVRFQVVDKTNVDEPLAYAKLGPNRSQHALALGESVRDRPLARLALNTLVSDGVRGCPNRSSNIQDIEMINEKVKQWFPEHIARQLRFHQHDTNGAEQLPLELYKTRMDRALAEIEKAGYDAYIVYGDCYRMSNIRWRRLSYYRWTLSAA